jgi:hypothetical protein
VSNLLQNACPCCNTVGTLNARMTALLRARQMFSLAWAITSSTRRSASGWATRFGGDQPHQLSAILRQHTGGEQDTTLTGRGCIPC